MRKLFLLLFALLAFAAPAYSTDVQIGASTIPGFNAQNLPPDVTVSPVSVVNGSPTVTCSNCFRQQWVGLGGFRIQINTVPYTVAYVTSRSSLTLTTNYAAGDSSAATILWHKYVELRIYADSSFQPAGKTYIVQPGAPGSGAWHRRVAASVVNELGVNNLYIPQLTLDATTDSLTNQAARYTAAFYRPEGSLIQFYDCFESFLLAPTGATTWPDICMFNTRQVIVQDDTTYTKTQIDSFRTGCTTGQSLFYASTGLKPTCLNIGTGLQITGDTLSATAGSSYQTILNNGTPLTQRTSLNFLAPGLSAVDNVGGLRTDVDLDGDLNALASNSVNGLWARTGSGTGAARTITGTLNRIGVTNGDGVAGPPTIDIGSTVATSGNNLSFFSPTTSAQLAGVISDETGSNTVVFSSSPTINAPSLLSPRVSTGIFDANSNAIINLTATASAVNQFTVTNAATGGAVDLAATGTDANIGITLSPKGTGGTTTSKSFSVTNAALTVTRNSSDIFLALSNSVAGVAAAMTTDVSGVFSLYLSGGSTIFTVPLSTQVVTFNQIPVLPASNPTTANQAVRKQYVDDRKTAFSFSWGMADPSAPTVGAIIAGQPSWVCPDGTAITITKLSVKYDSGSHTTGGSVTFTVEKRTAASSWATTVAIGTVTLDNTNNVPFVVFTNDITDAPLAAGDTLIMYISARSGTVTERDVSVAVRGTQQVF